MNYLHKKSSFSLNKTATSSCQRTKKDRNKSVKVVKMLKGGKKMTPPAKIIPQNRQHLSLNEPIPTKLQRLRRKLELIANGNNRGKQIIETVTEYQRIITSLLAAQKINSTAIDLNGLKSLNIPDYQDEFMSHYAALSESWRRDLANQKRY